VRKDGVRGQQNLERTAETVGKRVRATIREIGGTMPEELEPAQHLPKVASGIKKTAKEMKKLDNPKNAAPKDAKK
jgi:DNA-damage-inducible protein D